MAKFLIVFLAVSSFLLKGVALLDVEKEESDTSTTVAEKPKSCHLRELQLCAITASSVFQNPNGIPTTEADLQKQCKFIKEASDCFNDYSNRCLPPIIGKISGMFLEDFINIKDELCSKESEFHNSFIKHSPCLNKVQKSQQGKCMTDFQAGYEKIQQAQLADRMTVSCCNTNRLKKCFYDKIGEQCGEDATEFVDTSLKRLFSKISNVVCRDYDPFGSKCSSLPASGTKPRGSSFTSRLISTYASVKFNP